MLASIIDGTVRVRFEACDETFEMHADGTVVRPKGRVGTCRAAEKLLGFLSLSKATFWRAGIGTRELA